MWLSGSVARPGGQARFSKMPPRRVATPGRYRRRHQPNEAVLILVLFLLLILVLFYFS